jgi:hypothetical protein
MKKLSKIAFIVSAMLLVFAGCEMLDLNIENSTNSPSKSSVNDSSRLMLWITDDPALTDYMVEAKITLIKVELRYLEDSTGQREIVIFEDTMSYDLLSLRNGIMKKLVDIEVPNGKVDLIRLYVDKASVLLVNGKTTVVKVPSGSQSGIKAFIDPPLNLRQDIDNEIIIDFDVEKSFVVRGSGKTVDDVKGFNFKPVLRVENKTTSGFVEGKVKDSFSQAIANAKVSISSDSLTATAFSDSSGYYAIPALPAGMYSMFSAKDAYDTVRVEEVIINAGDGTVQNFKLNLLE